MGYRSKMRRRRSRKSRKTVISAILVIALVASVVLLVRAGVKSISGFFSRGASSLKIAKADDMRKNIVVIGAESTESKNLAGGVMLVQVDGVKNELNAISMTPNTFVEVPGQGFERIGESLQTGPDTVVVTVSNLLGVKAAKYVIISESQLTALLEKKGFKGLTQQVLGSNMKTEEKRRAEELIAEVAQNNVSVVPLPVEPIAIGSEMYYQPKKDDIDKLVAGWWQVTKRKEQRRLRVMVLNGAGVPGIAGEVASALIGHGYQVIDSKNADSFNYAKTLILLYHATKEEGLAVRQAIGTGQVMVKDIPQDIEDLGFHILTRDLFYRQRIRDLGAPLAVWHQRALGDMNLGG